MPELKITKASKPVKASLRTYDLSYEFDFTPIPRSTPKPIMAVTDIDLAQSQTMVVNTGSNSTNEKNIYTTWSAETVNLVLDDWTNPHSTWRLKYGAKTYWQAPYGLISSSSYPSSIYELVSIDHLYISGNYRGLLLYNVVNGAYEADGCMVTLASGGNRSSIRYEVTLRNKNTGDIITVTGSSIEYSVNKSPVGGNVMCLYLPESSFTSNGDMKGQIRMTETPI